MKKNIEILKNWLENPKRDFKEGLAIFEALATKTLKEEYLAYLQKAEDTGQFSQQMAILTNRLSAIKNMIAINPSLFKDAKIITLKKEKPDDADMDALNAKIQSLQKEIDALNAKLEESEDDNTDLQDELEEKTAELEELNEELEELKEKRGLQVVEFSDMPKKIQKLYDRNRQITPLMASIHNDISNESTTEESRRALVGELCKLDDERRGNWDQIDAWAEGKGVKVEDEENEKPLYDSDPVVAGLQMARRIERLKENIRRSEESAKTGKSKVIRENAEKRVATYQAELNELQALIPADTKKDAE